MCSKYNRLYNSQEHCHIDWNVIDIPNPLDVFGVNQVFAADSVRKNNL